MSSFTFLYIISTPNRTLFGDELLAQRSFNETLFFMMPYIVDTAAPYFSDYALNVGWDIVRIL